MTNYNTTYDQAVHKIDIKMSGAAGPFSWLRAGWQDLTDAPMLSLLFGGIFTMLCAAAYVLASALPMFSVLLLALLLIVSPFLAAAAYSVARQREQKLTPSLSACLNDISNRALNIGLFSILSALIVAAWVRLSGIVFALYYGTLGDSAAYLARAWTSGSDMSSMFIFMTSAGIVLALTLFTIGAFALPMIADRKLDIVNAAHKSIQTVKSNIPGILVWMLLLVTLVAAALASALILMPVVFPLLAYATWHSYRELSA